jgi:ABC-type transporter Mla MlaB component
MLRITHINDHDSVSTLRLEGKLQGPWVAEFARSCEEPPCSPDRLRLDLSAVTFVDGPGVVLLSDLLGRGVTLSACSGLVAELLHREAR